MKIRLKNSRMAEMLHQLRPLLSHRDMIGYVAARNCRILSECLTEYEAFRRDLIAKHGEEVTDDNGMTAYQIKIDSPAFKAFCDEMAPYNEMEHEVDLMTAKYTDAIGCLSGEEILNVDWMLED